MALSGRGGVGSKTLILGPVGADLMLSGVYRTLIYISTVRPDLVALSGRGGVGSKTLIPGSVGADLMFSGVYRTLI